MSYFAILLKKFQPIRVEAIVDTAVSTLKPGMLVQLNADGEFILNAAADINARGAIIAIEDELQGNDRDDTYAALSLCQAEVLQPGDEVQVMLDGDVAAVVIGDRLHPSAGGIVAELANGSFVALEAVTLASGQANQLIKARYLG